MLLYQFWVRCKWPWKCNKNITCSFSGICLFHDFVILAPIATIFLHAMHSSVLNLMVLKGASANYAIFWFLHGSVRLLCQWQLQRLASSFVVICRNLRDFSAFAISSGELDSRSSASVDSNSRVDMACNESVRFVSCLSHGGRKLCGAVRRW